jgi:hypothetical protein
VGDDTTVARLHKVSARAGDVKETQPRVVIADVMPEGDQRPLLILLMPAVPQINYQDTHSIGILAYGSLLRE